jgi:AcrR family transcriptional regulator
MDSYPIEDIEFCFVKGKNDGVGLSATEQIPAESPKTGGVMVNKGGDRRVRRTRKHLQDAVLSLIRERGFDALTVQDILDRADVGRSTFYTHFTNKEDLLVQGLEDLRDDLKELQRRVASAAGGAPFEFAGELLAHADEHRDVFRAMVGERAGALVQRRFQKMLGELLRDELQARLSPSGKPSVLAEAVTQYLASGLYGLMASWLDGSVPMSVAEMTELFRRLAVAAVRVASG